MTEPDSVIRSWRDGEDPDRSVFDTRRLLAEAVDSHRPMAEKLELLVAATDPMLDGPGGEPMAIFRTASLLAKEHRALEDPPGAEARMRVRVAIEVARVRGLHCDGGHARRALAQAIAVVVLIENEAGGRDKMLTAVAADERNAVAECMADIVGPLAATLKRGRAKGDPVRNGWVGDLRRFVDSYIPGLDASQAILYPGTPRMVQLLYLLLEEADPQDAKRIAGLYDLDVRARLRDWRGLVTIPMREAAMARHGGDAEGFAKISGDACRRLAAAQLYRHRRVALSEGYIEEPTP